MTLSGYMYFMSKSFFWPATRSRAYLCVSYAFLLM